ncbi:uncharacterized protein LOC135482115 isoform X2 [Liolophura sinensis]|uniref:uncharacterized protein LOC135482115 isoform X2 n=1 Tax=Liolophura sinensis TaxID=3198878 RepID=UPI0031595ADF
MYIVHHIGAALKMKILLKEVYGSEEMLTCYMEILTDKEVRVLHFVPPVAVVEIETEIDMRELNRKCAARPLASHTVTAEEWQMKTLCVLNVDPGTSEELLELYFSNAKRSSGGRIVSVCVNKHRGNAWVTFEKEIDAERVLRREHKVSGRRVSLQPFLGTVDISEQQHVLEQGGDERDLDNSRINRGDRCKRVMDCSRDNQREQDEKDMNRSRVNLRSQDERDMDLSRTNWQSQDERDMDLSRSNWQSQDEGDMDLSRTNWQSQDERDMDLSRTNWQSQDERDMDHSTITQQNQWEGNAQQDDNCNRTCRQPAMEGDLPVTNSKLQPYNQRQPDPMGFRGESSSPEVRQELGASHQYHQYPENGCDSRHTRASERRHFVETVMDNLMEKTNQLQVLKEDGFYKTERECSVNIASNGIVIIKGPKDDVDQAKLDLYDALEKVKCSTVPQLSSDLLHYATQPSRLDIIRNHLNETGFEPFSLSFADNCLKVWTLSQDSADTAAKEVKTLFSTKKFKVQPKYQDICRGSEFAVFLSDAMRNQGVIIKHQNFAVECEGFKQDVEATIQSIKDYLESNKSQKREVSLSLSEAKFLDRHARKHLRDIETNAQELVKVWLNNEKPCIEISGKQGVTEEVEKKVKDFLKSLCNAEVNIEEPGIREFFRDQGIALIQAVENRAPCVLDMTGTGQTRGAKGSGGDRRPGREDKGSPDSIPHRWPAVTVSQGNITDSQASVLVNVVGRELNLSRGALSKTFLRVGGQELQKALSRNHTPADFGEVLITRTRGDLRCEYVYHAVCPRWNPRYGAKAVTDIVSKCLTEANKHHSRSIGLPSVGAGGLGYPADVLIQAFKSSLCHFIQNTQNLELKEIFLIIYDKEVFELFKEAFTDGWMSSTSSFTPGTNSKGGNSVRIAVTTTKERVEEVKKLIRRHVKDAYCVDEIRDPSLQNPPKALKGLITSLSGQVSIRLDGGKISVYGSKSAVDFATKEIFKCLHENRPASQKPSLLLKTKGVKAYMDAKAKETIYAPGHWKNFNKRDVPLTEFIDAKDEKYKLVDASKQETADITKLFVDSWANCNVQVTQVQRVENPELYQKFASRRQLFYSKAAKGKIQILSPPPITTTFQIQNVDRYCRKEINECLLFHGTRNVSGILDSGLDFRVGGNGKFGKGIYMAECASLSHGFSSPGNFRAATPFFGLKSLGGGGGGKTCMFVVRAVLGNCFKTNNQGNYVRPPCMVSSCNDQINCLQHGDRYDTVVGSAGFREFVIYDSAQCYPEYLITLS